MKREYEVLCNEAHANVKEGGSWDYTSALSTGKGETHTISIRASAYVYAGDEAKPEANPVVWGKKYRVTVEEIVETSDEDAAQRKRDECIGAFGKSTDAPF